jgi:hypothetical protein
MLCCVACQQQWELAMEPVMRAHCVRADASMPPMHVCEGGRCYAAQCCKERWKQGMQAAVEAAEEYCRAKHRMQPAVKAVDASCSGSSEGREAVDASRGGSSGGMLQGEALNARCRGAVEPLDEAVPPLEPYRTRASYRLVFAT